MLGAINNFRAQSLQVGVDGRYIPCGFVEEVPVTLGKRVLYTVVGGLLRILRFMV